MLNGLQVLSGSLGIAGALVGVVFTAMGYTNPDIAKLQSMITDTQN